MAEEKKKFTWLDLLIIVIALICSSGVEGLFHVKNPIGSFFIFMAAFVVFMVAGTYIKYLLIDRKG